MMLLFNITLSRTNTTQPEKRELTLIDFPLLTQRKINPSLLLLYSKDYGRYLVRSLSKNKIEKPCRIIVSILLRLHSSLTFPHFSPPDPCYDDNSEGSCLHLLVFPLGCDSHMFVRNRKEFQLSEGSDELLH